MYEFPEIANILSSTSAHINREFPKPTTSMCNQEDKQCSGYEIFDNANVAASSLMLFNCSGKEGRIQEPCEFPESANILSSTSVYINRKFPKPTTSMCNQEEIVSAAKEPECTLPEHGLLFKNRNYCTFNVNIVNN
jgi:hypothetical protein